MFLDSLNRDWISPYGNERVETRNLQALADRGVVFDHHYLCSGACMPARCELFSGRAGQFLWRAWGPVEPFDRLLPLEARRLGAVTALVTDHYHYWEFPAHGFHEGYDCTRLIRGHEYDAASTEPVGDPSTWPAWVHAYLKWRPENAGNPRYYRNVMHLRGEEDFHGPRVMREACDWLDANHSHEKFFLHVESFDPHEPWHVPEPYRSMYGPYDENYTCWPPYQNKKQAEKFLKEASEEEIQFARNQYAGKVTMVDRWLGRLWDKMDQYDLWEDTLVIVTTDHGHSLADRSRPAPHFGKSHPIFEDVARIPLLIYHPGVEGGRRVGSTFSNVTDVRATILHALGARERGSVMVDGVSLLPVLEGKTKSVRDYAVYGEFGTGVGLSTPEANYVRGYDPKKPLYNYTCELPIMLSATFVTLATRAFGFSVPFKVAEAFLNRVAKKVTSGHFVPGVKLPQWRVPVPKLLASRFVAWGPKKKDYLFDRRRDPELKENLAGAPEGRELERKMVNLLKRALREMGTPQELFERFRLDASPEEAANEQ
ncbi:MAG: sulfatase [Promethearchaeota archaeon]